MDVYFGRNFWHNGMGREEHGPGSCLRCGAKFRCGGFWWRAPAVYVCQEGIVVDICRRVPGEAVGMFWDVCGVLKGREEEMSPAQQWMAVKENPFSFEANFRVEIDGREWASAGGSSMCIQPRGLDGEADVRDGGDREADVRDVAGWEADVKDVRGREADVRDVGGQEADVRDVAGRKADVRDGGGRKADARDGGGQEAHTGEAVDRPAYVGDGTSQEVSGRAVPDQETCAGKATVGDGAPGDMRRKAAGHRPEDVLAAEYGLDGLDGWQVFRRSFRAKDPESAAALKNAAAGGTLTFRLTVEAGEEQIPCGYTFVTEVGCGERTERFSHPVTGQKMELVILGCRPYNMEAEVKNIKKCLKDYRIPSHGCVMEYVLKSELPLGESLAVRDCCQGDGPVLTKEAKGVGKRAAAVTLIGGCDGPVSVFIGGTTKGQHEEERSLGYSSLYVEPVKEVRWRVELRGGLFDPETFELRAEGEDYGAKGQD